MRLCPRLSKFLKLGKSRLLPSRSLEEKLWDDLVDLREKGRFVRLHKQV